MSAFVVDKAHIAAMVQTAAVGPADVAPNEWALMRGSPENADALGELLIQANLKSIYARYPDCITNPEAIPGPVEQYWSKPYSHTFGARRLSCVQLLKAINCYRYQSCETSDWENSEAAKWCDRLEHQVICSLPGYDEADWEIAA